MQLYWKKLYCFARPTHLGVLVLVKRPRDVDIKARDKKQADNKTEVHWLAIRVEDQRSNLEYKSRNLRSQDKNLN